MGVLKVNSGLILSGLAQTFSLKKLRIEIFFQHNKKIISEKVLGIYKYIIKFLSDIFIKEKNKNSSDWITTGSQSKFI